MELYSVRYLSHQAGNLNNFSFLVDPTFYRAIINDNPVLYVMDIASYTTQLPQQLLKE